MQFGEKLLLTGPNRRSECTIIEQQLVFTEEELDALESSASELIERLASTLESLAIPTSGWLAGNLIEKNNAPGLVAQLFTGTALALQRSAGHRVSEQGFCLDGAGRGVWAWFEYEHDEVGVQASIFGLRLLAALETALQWQGDGCDSGENLKSDYQKFLEFARPLVLPLDTEAIIRAAQSLDIPCVKLERLPYAGASGSFRIRPNGLLMLGHCGYQKVVDGTICIQRNAGLLPLLRDHQVLRQRLAPLQIPWPRQDPDTGNCIITRRAVRAAGRIGYPVVVKPGGRVRGKGITLNVSNAQEIPAAIELARSVSTRVIVEAMVSGATYRILVANHQVLGVIGAGCELPLKNVHETILALAGRTSQQLDCGLLVMTIVTDNPSLPLSETHGAVVGVDLAPELDALLPADSALLQQSAIAFVQWLYPEGSPSRIPVVAVTGTNGKTTTCRMIARIMQMAGRHTGMICSEGLYVEEKFEASMGDIGHGVDHRVFELQNVDFAILEEYFGRICRQGFPFLWCDVAVCTNVTEDHLGRIGVHTLQQMAELKLTLPLRARYAVVLNADDHHCMQMVNKVTARNICLVSCQLSKVQLAEGLKKPGCFVVLEKDGGKDLIVIHDGMLRKPLIAVDDIPATFSGLAMHNTANAMHAAAACYLSGAGMEEIARGLASFRMGIESTPGRLNIFDGLPFRIIMDYAHNADGFRKLSAFIDSQKVGGRKIIMFSFTGDRRDQDLMAAVPELAGHFDHFICRNYLDRRGRRPEEIPRLLETALLNAGVSETAICSIPDSYRALQFSVGLARPGDLLVLLAGEDEFDDIWTYINSYRPPWLDSTASSELTK